MSLLAHISWIYAVSGLVVGILVGLTGVGGGSLMTPLLVLIFGVSPATAVGTDLLYAAITKSVGIAVHGFNRTVDWRIVRRLASGSIPGTAGTLLFLHLIGISGPAQHNVITKLLGVALILTAICVLFRKRLLDRLAPVMSGLSETTLTALTVSLGFLLGVFVTLSSVGAGAIGVTVLLLLYPGAPLVRIVGADIAHAVPLTLIAGLGHWYLGTINWAVLGSLLVGSIPGIFIASFLVRRAPDAVLRPIMACVLLIVGVRLLT